MTVNLPNNIIGKLQGKLLQGLNDYLVEYFRRMIPNFIRSTKKQSEY